MLDFIYHMILILFETPILGLDLIALRFCHYECKLFIDIS